ncbi:AAA family ATPase [Plantactinospora sp. S1510]|uniref:AAA family ATPase n=1 Tax=Plantactinospora alkalitolerans TaxID=2789879 RepID=A0ABS0GVT6_9ACTN|nr:LuxR family transcriptional regulator [Plantactinospora alkalitolerans]MBF9130310.1 AAA family ATPase [Plantactinospora alkalitolerans]
MSLVERDGDLAAIHEVLAAAVAGRGMTVLVEGPPGIGKTAVLAAASEYAMGLGVRVLTSIGGELEQDLPFAIVRQLLEPPLRAASSARSAELLAGAAGLAAPVFGQHDDTSAAGVAQGDVVYGLYWLCANLAESEPLLLVVDDVQWADGASLRFLSHLARRIADLPVLLLLAGRPGRVLDGLVGSALGGVAPRVVRLRRLSDEAVGVLVRRDLSAEADDEFCHACAVATGGNPFLLAEALTNLRTNGTRPVAAEAHRVEHLRAAAISRAVLARVARLGPDAVGFARALAVLGTAAQPRHVAALAGLSVEAAATAADRLARESIVTTKHPVSFVHPLVRTAVYGDSSSLLHAADHKRAARVLAADDADAEQLAPHLLAAEPESDPWVVDRLEAAAFSALGRGAPESAAAYLTRARVEPPPLARRGPLAAMLGRVLAMAARTIEAADVLREAVALTAPLVDRIQLVLELGFLLTQTGRAPEAVQAAELARGLIAGHQGELSVAMYAAVAGLDLITMQPPEGVIERLDAVVARPIGTSDADRLLLSTLAFGAAGTGGRSANEVAALAERAATGPVPMNEGWMLVNYASAALTIADRLPEALELLDRGLDATSRLGDVWDFRYVSMLRSHTAWYAGRLIEAEGDARAALEEVPGEPRRRNAPLAAAMLVDVLVERGRLDEARQVLEDYEISGHKPTDTVIMHFIPMARGRLRLRCNEPAAALVDLLDVGRFLVDAGYVNPGFAEWRTDAVRAHVALGDPGAAVELAHENLELARVFGAPRSIARALRTLAMIESGKPGLDRLAEAVELLTDSPAELERAHCLIFYGVALRHAGQRILALDPLRRGLDLATRCGAEALAESARQELRAAGARPRRDAVRGREALTISELRVARLAAGGATNRDIAQTLFLTPRTVEAHLTNAYRKLEVKGRQQLSRAIAEPPP